MNGEKLLEVSLDKHGSALIETCIESASKQQIETIAKTACFNQGLVLKQILGSSFGNYVAKKLLFICRDYVFEKQLIIDTTHNYIVNLDDYYYGRTNKNNQDLKYCDKFLSQCVHYSQ